ncbi:methyl-accepting chemotaxis protein [Lysinibacillus sp. NPDC097287]|uniref:methyl-accepting chemotaxis protein n=1 Tax=Lysinibacillus sp. NPDC097287 TaxID=3364144 RepID=UPI003819211D
MSIRKKLLVSFSISIIVTVLACTVIFMQLRSIDAKYSNTIALGLPQINLTSEIEYYTLLQTAQVQSYLLGDQKALDQVESSQQKLQDITKELKSLLQREEVQQKLTGVVQDINIFEKSVNETININNTQNVNAAIDHYNTEVKENRTQTITSTDELSTLIDTLFENAQLEADKRAQQALFIAILIIIIAVIIGASTSFMMNRLIAIPLKNLQSNVQQIAKGNLTVPSLAIRSNDEVGQLTTSFNAMKDTLKNLIMQLSDSATHLSSSAEELSASTEEVTVSSVETAQRSELSAQNTLSAAQTAQESAVAMDETASAVQRIAESSQNLHTKASETTIMADQGATNINSASKQMTTIYQSTKLTTELIQKLSKQSEEIESISRVITSITEQTNLLALNAAIEAARAGEHGKGFAVVADEVRKLAVESNASASQIVALTNEIQTDTKNVEKAVRESLQIVEDGVGIINEAGLSFSQIENAVDDMKLQIEDISAITEEISAAAEEVAASVSEIAIAAKSTAEQAKSSTEASQQQLSTLQEISAVSNDLSTRALDLQNAVNQFRV